MTCQSFSCSLCFSATLPPYQSSLIHQECFNPCFTTQVYSYPSYPHNFLLHLLQGSQMSCSQWDYPWSPSPKLCTLLSYTYTHIILLSLHLLSWALVTSLYILLIYHVRYFSTIVKLTLRICSVSVWFTAISSVPRIPGT